MPPESSDDEAPLVLLTGATGFIGLRILYHLLKQNYHVRCAVRSISKATYTIPAVPIIAALRPSPTQLSYIEVADFGSPNAWTEAIKGVTYVVHVASPLPGSNPQGHLNAQEAFIQPAVRGSLGVLEAAASTPSIRRVVITSSVVAFIPAAVWTGQQSPSPGTVYTAQSRLSTPTENVYPAPGAAYCASKVASLNAAEEWVAARQRKLGFDLIHIHPGWVMGHADIYHDDLEAFMQSTNRYAVWVAQGESTWVKGGLAVDVDDCAIMHVNALSSSKLPVHLDGRCRSFLAAQEWRWVIMNEVARESFPEEVNSGVFQAEEKEGTAKMDADAGDVEGVLGVRLRPVKESARDLLRQFLDLKKTAKSGKDSQLRKRTP